MSDGMRRELAYLSSHATNRYFIPNWGREVAAWKAIVGEKSRSEEAAKAEAERIATEKAEAERKGKERRKESC